MTHANNKIFDLDDRHLTRDHRSWKSSADPFYGSTMKIRSEVIEWLVDQKIQYIFNIPRRTLYIDDIKHALLFKLAWM